MKTKNSSFSWNKGGKIPPAKQDLPANNEKKNWDWNS